MSFVYLLRHSESLDCKQLLQSSLADLCLYRPVSVSNKYLFQNAQENLIIGEHIRVQ